MQRALAAWRGTVALHPDVAAFRSAPSATSVWFHTHAAPLKGPARALETHPEPKYVVVHPRSLDASHLHEALSLIKTAHGVSAAHITTGSRSGRDSQLRGGRYLRAGQLDTIRAFCAHHNASHVLLNFAASGSALSNVSEELSRYRDDDAGPLVVEDRTALVLRVFRLHATTNEARLQVRLAELEYQAARLVRRRDAKGRLVLGVAGQEVEIVSERGQGGTVGAVGGSGEREAVKRRAALRHDVARVRRELVEVRRRRERQRARRALEGHRTVALVGYTNAGKSSLMAALCGVEAGAEDKLFATLDTRIRAAALPAEHTVLLVDTVGFIQGLPHDLVAAFRATLDEALSADVLLHVIDAASPQALQQRDTVLRVLDSLGVDAAARQRKLLEVWNKADVASARAAACEHLFTSASAASAEKRTGRGEEVAPTQAELQRAMQMWLAVQSTRKRGYRGEQGEQAEGDDAPDGAPTAEARGETDGQSGDSDDEGAFPNTQTRASSTEESASNEGEPNEGLRLQTTALDFGSPERPAGVVVSATRGWGLEELRRAVETRLAGVAVAAAEAPETEVQLRSKGRWGARTVGPREVGG